MYSETELQRPPLASTCRKERRNASLCVDNAMGCRLGAMFTFLPASHLNDMRTTLDVFIRVHLWHVNHNLQHLSVNQVKYVRLTHLVYVITIYNISVRLCTAEALKLSLCQSL
jgi:hypothetical protein